MTAEIFWDEVLDLKKGVDDTSNATQLTGPIPSSICPLLSTGSLDGCYLSSYTVDEAVGPARETQYVFK
jgi:hypothetical protein